MIISKVTDARHDISNLVADADYYHIENPDRALDILDQAKAKLQEMYCLIWAMHNPSGVPKKSL